MARNTDRKAITTWCVEGLKVSLICSHILSESCKRKIFVMISHLPSFAKISEVKIASICLSVRA